MLPKIPNPLDRLDPDRGPDSLVQVPLEVIRRLENEPVLLGGMGASAFLAIIAIFAPSSDQIYAWIIAGMMMILCLARGFMLGFRQTRDDDHLSGDPLVGNDTNSFETGSAKIDDDVTFVARRRNIWRSRRRTIIKGSLSMRAGFPAAPPGHSESPENQ